MFNHKNILIIGGTGTIGQAMVKQLIKYQPKVIRILSRDEYKQFNMQQELKEKKNIRFLLGDVRDKERIDRAMNDIDIVFHLAALKHVPACEYDPFEAVKTNVIGVQNVIECAIKNRVERVIYSSSDKAVSPTNTMGATKLLAERLISAADYSKGDNIPIFASVRFGNVIGSRGSVIPLWKKQIIEHRQIEITNPNMTRFMMTIDEAVNLTLKACELAKGGETFVLKMPVIKLGDLAEVVVETLSRELGLNDENVNIKEVGLRTGEKMYEELMTEDESNYAIEYEDMFAIQPLYKNVEIRNKLLVSYSSRKQTILKKEEIKKIINGLTFTD
ncbi:polysaccharide biosynthesis protein [Natranaerovirga pectinivora]|uniref:Polysaccharide biosynthesis protein n=1 Tax=Natranaerovirga pectinivora TaxID=682400 RepID=A0A4R3MN44_9FIRM|nr:UDP-N-acetylglucosamine 4,6-dehydratase family protein [Natranaerovirga pectinivora]TCT14022.1 polysaccharide biosynthesis protein [Natranaerovirga pectinivora]